MIVLEPKNSNKSQVPSFIRLFVVRRLFCNMSRYNDNYVAYTTEEGIEYLINKYLPHESSNHKSHAGNILLRLKKYGIKFYMSQFYNEKTDSILIEKIFENIILKKFAKEYSKIITFTANYIDHDDNWIYRISRMLMNHNQIDHDHDRYYFQNLVFNTNDLMTNIFEYLQYQHYFKPMFIGDLNNCSLVNSYWLYHSFNINSIYHFELSGEWDGMLYSKTSKCIANNDNNITRIWQR